MDVKIRINFEGKGAIWMHEVERESIKKLAFEKGFKWRLLFFGSAKVTMLVASFGSIKRFSHC